MHCKHHNRHVKTELSNIIMNNHCSNLLRNQGKKMTIFLSLYEDAFFQTEFWTWWWWWWLFQSFECRLEYKLTEQEKYLFCFVLLACLIATVHNNNNKTNTKTNIMRILVITMQSSAPTPHSCSAHRRHHCDYCWSKWLFNRRQVSHQSPGSRLIQYHCLDYTASRLLFVNTFIWCIFRAANDHICVLLSLSSNEQKSMKSRGMSWKGQRQSRAQGWEGGGEQIEQTDGLTDRQTDRGREIDRDRA